jgi:cytochrome oxidase Cu insertion factor (SCO1/SenC/PrrC family)
VSEAGNGNGTVHRDDGEAGSGTSGDGQPSEGAGSGAVPPVDRAAAFAAGAPKISRTVVYWIVAAVLVLGLGGTLVDHFLGSDGAASATVSTSTTQPATTATSTSVPGTTPGTAPATGKPELQSSMASFLDLTTEGTRPAPGFTLTGAGGAPVSLSALSGHVVVLTFADAACDDICPVLAQELAKADALLGATPVPVSFVTVNTDPLDLRDAATAPITTTTTLPTLANWQFATGTVHQLDPVWKAYGVSITVQPSTRTVSHNEVLFFVRPDGRLAWRATPFADESRSGTYSLPAGDVARFAQGIATYAAQLAATPAP